MKSFLNVFFFISFAQLFGQTINFSDQAFKQQLLLSNSGNFIAQNLNGDFFAIDSNANNQIEVNEALLVSSLNIEGLGITSLSELYFFLNLRGLNCSYNNLQNLDVSTNTNLVALNCSNNSLQTLDITNLSQLEVLNCSNNFLSQLNLNSSTLNQLYCDHNNISSLNFLEDALQLETLNCSYNLLTQINLTDFVLLTDLNCSNNLLTSIDLNSNGQLIKLSLANNLITSLVLINMSSLEEFDCSFNSLNQLVLQNLNQLRKLNFRNNSLTGFNFIGISGLQDLDCSYNQLTAIDLTGYSSLINLNCSHNQLSVINFVNLLNLSQVEIQQNDLLQVTFMNTNQIRYFNCSSNFLSILDISQLTNLLQLNCSGNNLISLELTSNTALQSLIAHNNQISVLDCSSNSSLANIEIQQNLLSQLNIKNGSIENLVNFSSNPNLAYLCCDFSELNFVNYLTSIYSLPNCLVNDYCNVPQNYSLLTIENRIDSNINSQCDIDDLEYTFLKLNISDSNQEIIYFSNQEGLFTDYFPPNYYLITPEVFNANNFSISSSEINVDFPADSPFSNDFCIEHQASINDLEVFIFPDNADIVSNMITLNLVINNNGNINANGILQLNYALNSFVFNSSIVTPSTNSNGTLGWVIDDFLPGEKRTISVTFQIIGVPSNSQFVASITSNSIPDNQTLDNTFIYQMEELIFPLSTVVGLKGNTISTNDLEPFQYYMVSFTNTSNQVLNQLKFQIQIPSNTYQETTFWPVFSNFSVITRKVSSNLDLMFNNINLATNQKIVYIFKVKPNQNLQNGETLVLSANVYETPFTVTASSQYITYVQDLKNQAFQYQEVHLYPNPCNDFIKLRVNGFEPVTYKIFDFHGRIIQNRQFESVIQTSSLLPGVYFIQFSDGKSNITRKFLKK